MDQLRAAVDSASSEARAAYASFTIFALYFATTVGATSHEGLLRGSEVTMPGLGVGLPIVGFYVLVPPLFLLFHALLLIQLNVLASRVRRLREATSEPGELSGPPFVLSQFLLGNIRGFLLGPMVYGAMWVSLILLPIGVLIFVQVRFLPYHSDWVTWWHRILIVVDLGLVWLLWPRILKPAASTDMASAVRHDHGPLDRRTNSAHGGSGSGIAPNAPMAWRGLGLTGLGALTAVTLLFSWTLATIPESSAELAQMAQDDAVCSPEDQDAQEAHATVPPPAYEICRLTWNLWSYFARVSLSPAVAGGPVRTVRCLSYLLFEAPTTPLNMRRNLQVRSADLVPAPPRDVVTEQLGADQAWGAHGRGLDLRGRDLRYADLSSSDLRKADLRGADLLGANLSFADLRYAKAGAVKFSDFDGCKAALRAGDLCLNRLRGANLQNADLRSSQFREADLRQANLNYTNLQGIDLASARLEDASLKGASLQGAELHSAVMDRADLKGARLAGSDLSEASLQHTCLKRTDITLAHLKKARLAHADLSEARLDGAFLPKADLTDANLTNTYFSGADLRSAKLDQVTLRDERGEAFFGWTDLRGIDERISGGLPGSDLALPKADPRQYELDLASLLAGKACRPNVSPFVVRSLIKRMIDDIHTTSRDYRAHHQKVAYRLLSQVLGAVGPLGEADSPRTDSLGEEEIPDPTASSLNGSAPVARQPPTCRRTCASICKPSWCCSCRRGRGRRQSGCVNSHGPPAAGGQRPLGAGDQTATPIGDQHRRGDNERREPIRMRIAG